MVNSRLSEVLEFFSNDVLLRMPFTLVIFSITFKFISNSP